MEENSMNDLGWSQLTFSLDNDNLHTSDNFIGDRFTLEFENKSHYVQVSAIRWSLGCVNLTS